MFWLKPVTKHLYKTKCDTWYLIVQNSPLTLLLSFFQCNPFHSVQAGWNTVVLLSISSRCQVLESFNFTNQWLYKTQEKWNNGLKQEFVRQKKSEKELRGEDVGRRMLNIIIIYTTTTATKMVQNKKNWLKV